MAIPRGVLSKPVFVKLWENYPLFSKAVINIGIFLKYKTLKLAKIPNKITLPSRNIIYINNAENRGRALLISDGITQSRVSEFWGEAVKSYKPTLVLDIGVNYGECIFSTQYEQGTTIVGIEANKYLMEYIERSRQQHVNRDQINIIHAFAGENENQDQAFFIDTHWSGTSSGVQISEKNTIEKTEVPAITVDSLFSQETLENHRLLFKIDVEGYEYSVLKGMINLLKNCREIMGIVEFDSRYLEKAGVNLDSYLTFLANYFEIKFYNEDNKLKKLTTPSISALQKELGTEHIHTDLILRDRGTGTVSQNLSINQPY
ncbi:FkbM family methyltransferase [Fredinandcohnia onubensis]|uniref:FkbM family methyltransferase n=1 Tax=Fredinandcohnia onubensis TaxID=1571209 RepID=UPI000C0BCC28|nr:FkbM family methyltransferase [Fredinandcohnia onubensis]